ncbi:MAG: Large-conductance mechanosensitive channel [candidate division WS6 bacterium 34_10]|jgi:large conductance mechanosensitive channel|uniref:Large-conductance mechanosensitive channel n=1 Tax=candidate division WS6 bacterium 34_10 TaxID=1641389 RepID=A0A101HI61_9BACT|nr:MAG: Large-conductance mechanosensitive channel [candidate division WS6 bacterium 34_10]
MLEKLKKTFKDFQEFAFKDAVLGAAVGIMIGTALKDLINSLVDNILMPPIAYITSGINFEDLFIVIGKGTYENIDAAREANALIITYGQFINSFISFLILAIALYLLINVFVKGIQKRLEREEEKKKKPTTKECPYCKTDIPVKAKRCPNCTSEL